MSPTVHRKRGLQYFFRMADLGEPPHVHVRRARSEYGAAKIWLSMPPRVAEAGQFNQHELNAMLAEVASHQEQFLQEWNKHAKRARKR